MADAPLIAFAVVRFAVLSSCERTIKMAQLYLIASFLSLPHHQGHHRIVIDAVPPAQSDEGIDDDEVRAKGSQKIVELCKSDFIQRG